MNKFGGCLLTVLFILIIPVSTNAKGTIWQIGTFGDGSSEFESDTMFFEVYDYEVDFNPDDEILAPNCPGYLKNRSHSGRWSTEKLNIIFSLDGNYSGVTLEYRKGGIETNRILLDETELTTVSGPGESKWKTFTIGIGLLTGGIHIISLEYFGGGVNNGNSIDALRLTGTFECRDRDEDEYLDVVCGGLDCDDLDPFVYPGALDDCDGIDQDCDGEDGVLEMCDGGLDEDCDGLIDGWDTDCCADEDGDSFTDLECGGADCDDIDPTVHPGMQEIQGDGIDNDCDGVIDESCFINSSIQNGY